MVNLLGKIQSEYDIAWSLVDCFTCLNRDHLDGAWLFDQSCECQKSVFDLSTAIGKDKHLTVYVAVYILVNALKYEYTWWRYLINTYLFPAIIPYTHIILNKHTAVNLSCSVKVLKTENFWK